MELLIQAVMSFGAVATLAMIFGVPRRFLIQSGFTGALGWVFYVALGETGNGDMLNMFVAAFAVAIASHLFARFCKAPVTIFLIPGILPLVPGVGVYRIAYYMIQESTAVAGYYLMYTLQMAGMIAVAILIADTFFKIIGRRA